MVDCEVGPIKYYNVRCGWRNYKVDAVYGGSRMKSFIDHFAFAFFFIFLKKKEDSILILR